MNRWQVDIIVWILRSWIWALTGMEGVFNPAYVTTFMNHAPVLLSGQSELSNSSCYSHGVTDNGCCHHPCYCHSSCGSCSGPLYPLYLLRHEALGSSVDYLATWSSWAFNPVLLTSKLVLMWPTRMCVHVSFQRCSTNTLLYVTI